MKNQFLVGEKVYLRPLSLDDLSGNYLFWLNDPEINVQNSHHVYPYPKETLEDYIKNAYTEKDKLPLAIVEKSNDIHIGNVSLVNIDYINKNTDWGIIIGERDNWNKGFSKEASFLILKHAFESLNMYRIYSGTTSKNIGGQKLMESMGMIKEGIRRNHIYKNGEYLDIIEYGVLKEEFYKKFNLTI